MQKKIIALAVAAALTAPAMAFAEATVYGIMDGSIDLVKLGDKVPSTAATNGASQRRVSANQSRIGFKGSDDLGDGLSAVWQLESSVDFKGGTVGSSRNTFVGLKGGFGTFLAGRHDTPYKLSTRRLDVFSDNVGDNRALLGGSNGPSAATATGSFDARNIESLNYMSPNMNGMSVSVQLANLLAANTLDQAAKSNTTSIAGMYDVAPLYVAVAYEKHAFETAAGVSSNETGTRLGAGYKMDAITVGLTYEKLKNSTAAGANTLGRTGLALDVAFAMSSNDTIKASYTKVGDIGDPSVNKSGAKQMAIGFDHKMSKSTKVYASYTKIDNDDLATYALFNHSSTLANLQAGADPSAISLGMKVNF